MHVTVLDVDSNRNYFTNHGFHLSGKGKTNVCMQLKVLVETPYTTYDRSPIPMEWIPSRDEDTNMEYIEGSGNLDNSLSNNRIRASSRSRRTPHNRRSDNTQSTRDNSKVCAALEPEYVDEEENANKEGIVIQEQAQDIADTNQPGNVDKTTEAHRTSTRNKKNPSIRDKDFLW